MDDVTLLFGGWEPVARIVVVGILAYIMLVLLVQITAKRMLAQMNAFDFIIGWLQVQFTRFARA